MLASGAALAFGVTTPIIAFIGRGLGPLTTAALLYAGAAAAALALRVVVRRRDPAVRRTDVPRLVVIGIVGGAIAPALLAWGLQRAGATAGSLLLNLEAVFTVFLARAFYAEPIGRRVALAVACMAAGGVVLALDGPTSGGLGLAGLGAVAGATLAWALDNTVMRPLAERDPFQVIAIKGAIGAAITTAIALARGEPAPTGTAVVVVLACGATGYGASLYLYLLAQRRIGAGRTGSVFALAPFVGAAIAWIAGARELGWVALPATVAFAIGVYLHVGERHGHGHVHAAVDHDHVHTHDDGHHDHVHDRPVVGAHSHHHHHDHIAHDHEHGSDLHHQHAHPAE